MIQRRNNESSVGSVPAEACYPSIANFTGAFPGQAVVNGRPNRLRRAAHYARASHIAAQSGNTIVSEGWTRLLKGLDLELGGVVDRRQERVDCV